MHVGIGPEPGAVEQHHAILSNPELELFVGICSTKSAAVTVCEPNVNAPKLMLLSVVS